MTFLIPKVVIIDFRGGIGEAGSIGNVHLYFQMLIKFIDKISAMFLFRSVFINSTKLNLVF